VNSPLQVRLIFDHVEKMISADRFLRPERELAVFTFDFYDWESRQGASTPSGALIADVRASEYSR
jgi:hypothetical protein